MNNMIMAEIRRSQAQAQAEQAPERCMWVKRCDLENQALPSLMRKVVVHALASGEA